MRLTKIKLAGFKTFVDPTSLQFPSNLTGIIGPNGCGKSNIIDAIRWVMGESSARNLRGDSMEDVIFSGSSTRSEVGKAFVELNFDNSSNTLDSKFARFSEIVIRREVSRDGISNYFLNNTKCRRKDIREVFLGTGLGPRSYAIIEQGMISKLVEAKPDELRTYLEEAAGISKYKEKRRETELRLKHTRENLNRLNDVMKEITSQLNKLERQAKLAKEFKSFKQDERKLKLSLLALKWNNYDQQIDNIEVQIRKVEINHEKEKSILSSKNKKIEELRESRNNEQSRFDKIQKDFYKLGSDIASCEKDIEHSQETETTRKEELDELSKKAVIAQKDLEMEAKKNVQVLENIEAIKEKNKSVSENLKNLEKNKKDVNFAMQNLLSKINTFIGTQSENIKKQEVEKTKLEASDNIDSDKNFHNKSVWKKIATTAAGPLFNFILAIFIFSIIFFFRGESRVQPYVGQVIDESPAYNAGLKSGDEIIYANNNEILYFNDLRSYILENPSREIELTVVRDGIEEKVFLTPEVVSSKDRFGNEYSSARIGVIGSQNPDHVEYMKYGPLSSVLRGTTETYNLSAKILIYIGNLIVGRESIDQMGGPIKIIQISGEISNYGIIPLLALIAAISVNLGIINLLPIPVLDGGHLLYYSFEVLRGKPLSQKTQEIGMQIGMSLLIALMIFVTFLDISRL